ncbi:hypothetical protein [Vibrio sp. Hal054]|uniref:hypothetical protein n=1 Tax=Vibrio sp. Hal054 TaxID=3035158 RepID=UPI00301DA201
MAFYYGQNSTNKGVEISLDDLLVNMIFSEVESKKLPNGVREIVVVKKAQISPYLLIFSKYYLKNEEARG